ncbi:MAG TPA: sodium/solute symporter [Planctomycetota bacterium]|jgi:SSS family solute:Na+ symporter
MAGIDFVVLGLYGAAMIALALWVGRSQGTRADYYLAGRSVPAWQITASILATQVSAVSLVGGPAFVAVKRDGGLIWLQYELAIPLAMIAVAAVFLPAYHASRVTTIYEYLERRFGPVARTSLSVAFMLTRGLATGIIIYTSAKVVAVPLGWNLGLTIAIVSGVTLAYTVVGGIKADILTDIVQLGVLWIATIVCLFFAGGFSLEGVDPARLRILDASRTGFGDGGHFALLPMVVGGFFLYVSYYACDQSQAQRLLTAPDVATARRAVLWNGLLRFPLALTYCAFGVVLAGFLARTPDFAAKVRDPNDLVPLFLLEHVPAGIRGLFIAGVLAAAMSSLDSALNSLSAATMEDVLRRFSRRFRDMEERAAMRWGRFLTFLWGAVCTGCAFIPALRRETVIETINQVGSMTYGPILGIFVLGILTRRATEGGAVAGLVAGVTVNLLCWILAPAISWLWWNVFGFAACVIVGGIWRPGVPREAPSGSMSELKRVAIPLGAAFAAMLAICLLLERALG